MKPLIQKTFSITVKYGQLFQKYVFYVGTHLAAMAIYLSLLVCCQGAAPYWFLRHLAFHAGTQTNVVCCRQGRPIRTGVGVPFFLQHLDKEINTR